MIASNTRRFLLVTDAWQPQVNGVVRTWGHVLRELAALGIETEVVHPSTFRTVAAPKYPEIRLALCTPRAVGRRIDAFDPDYVHIATEGPLGLCARHWCLARGLSFTTSYHTQFPLYLKQYFAIPPAITYRLMKWFHGAAEATLAPTPGVMRELRSHGIARAQEWCRGVDTGQFRPLPPALPDLPKPVFLYAGRVAVEKNIEAFLRCDVPGTKVVVGDGPERKRLERRYTGVHWAGYRFGDDLAAHYSSADAFVFPSRTDTFGIVMLEANACGLPIAAYPVTGPIDVVKPGINGALDEDLATAAMRALDVPRASCIEHARSLDWRHCAQVVLDHVAPVRPMTCPIVTSLGGVLR
jgi:glycosyltransferase involved in cell wall biosynthesis